MVVARAAAVLTNLLVAVLVVPAVVARTRRVAAVVAVVPVLARAVPVGAESVIAAVVGAVPDGELPEVVLGFGRPRGRVPPRLLPCRAAPTVHHHHPVVVVVHGGVPRPLRRVVPLQLVRQVRPVVVAVPAPVPPDPLPPGLGHHHALAAPPGLPVQQRAPGRLPVHRGAPLVHRHVQLPRPREVDVHSEEQGFFDGHVPDELPRPCLGVRDERGAVGGHLPEPSRGAVARPVGQELPDLDVLPTVQDTVVRVGRVPPVEVGGVPTLSPIVDGFEGVVRVALSVLGPPQGEAAARGLLENVRIRGAVRGVPGSLELMLLQPPHGGDVEDPSVVHVVVHSEATLQEERVLGEEHGVLGAATWRLVAPHPDPSPKPRVRAHHAAVRVRPRCEVVEP
mmetsp:Transcript_30379/g.68133  ORF Transcript_30379/g.68133 Transcript_30379/m.68133 type:complete len:394 (+) Transcript_30379:840-2021(+)